MKICLSGMGWITPNGIGSGKGSRQLEWRDGKLPQMNRDMITDKPDKHFGRLDEYTRLGLVGVAVALKDAHLDEWNEKREIGLIASTVYGCLSTDIAYYDTVIPGDGIEASPNLFAYTLPSCFIGEASIRFGLTGESFVVYDSSPSNLKSVFMAYESIAQGIHDCIICGTCDSGRPEVLSQGVPVLPGAFFLVIETVASLKTRPAYGTIRVDDSGHLLFNDAPIQTLIQLAEKALCQ